MYLSQRNGIAEFLPKVVGKGVKPPRDETIFQLLPYGPRRAIPPADLDRLAAEGAALPLADVVAFALREADPFGGR